uniref:sigma factor n=1 Tax=Nocardia cyriacigeorgica TaxID=135487 RepID=UPI0024587B2E
MVEHTGREAVAAVWRIESARIVGALARYTGDFALAEDLAQEAFAEALVTWPREGVPQQPAGWLLTVGKRRAIDAFRRRALRDDKYAVHAHGLGEGGVGGGGPPPPTPPTPPPGWGPPPLFGPPTPGPRPPQPPPPPSR